MCLKHQVRRSLLNRRYPVAAPDAWLVNRSGKVPVVCPSGNTGNVKPSAFNYLWSIAVKRMPIFIRYMETHGTFLWSFKTMVLACTICYSSMLIRGYGACIPRCEKGKVHIFKKLDIKLIADRWWPATGLGAGPSRLWVMADIARSWSLDALFLSSTNPSSCLVTRFSTFHW